MSTFSTNKNELMKRWMELYMNLMILRSHDPREQMHIDEMRDKLAELHGYMMDFFDAIGAEPGPVA